MAWELGRDQSSLKHAQDFAPIPCKYVYRGYFKRMPKVKLNVKAIKKIGFDLEHEQDLFPTLHNSNLFQLIHPSMNSE